MYLLCFRSKGSEVRGQSSTTNQPEGPEYKSLSHGQSFINVFLFRMTDEHNQFLFVLALTCFSPELQILFF